MTDPSTVQEWFDVARERGNDASSMLPMRSESVGPSYVAGYALESALKAYLQAKGIPRSTSGQAGHDLRALWKASGLKLRDLHDSDGSAAFFINDWSTALRYQAQRPVGQLDSEILVNTACRLTKFLLKLARRSR